VSGARAVLAPARGYFVVLVSVFGASAFGLASGFAVSGCHGDGRGIQQRRSRTGAGPRVG